MGSAVIPHVRARHAIVNELVSDRLPGIATVVGALNKLPEPATGLRSVETVWIDRRSLYVVDLPARKVRAANAPTFAISVRGQNKRALARAHQNSYTAHHS